MTNLSEDLLLPDPVQQFLRWQADWFATTPAEPKAMLVSTVDGDGQPWIRTVLLKQVDAQGFVFYTNRESHKGRQIEAGSRVALHFLWLATARQVQVHGCAQRTSAAEDDAYFASRPRESQLGAWASQQSRPLADRATLETRLAACTREYAGREVPRPPYWGGFRVLPERYEFWQAGAHRLHDRFEYVPAGEGWRIQRLNP